MRLLIIGKRFSSALTNVKNMVMWPVASALFTLLQASPKFIVSVSCVSCFTITLLQWSKQKTIIHFQQFKLKLCSPPSVGGNIIKFAFLVLFWFSAAHCVSDGWKAKHRSSIAPGNCLYNIVGMLWDEQKLLPHCWNSPQSCGLAFLMFKSHLVNL